MHKFCTAKWERKQEIWIWYWKKQTNKNSATSNVIWKTEWKNEILLPIPHKRVKHVPFQSLMLMKFPSWKVSDQCYLMILGYGSPHQHLLVTINPQEMSCALLASILKKEEIDSGCELLAFIAGLLHCPSVISLVDISYVIWCLVVWDIETQQKVV